jgi:glycosyltransferase involved in cell wall biosynthesis
MPYTPDGPHEEKKTPFYTATDRLMNLVWARAVAPPPAAIITRSPRVIDQLRRSWLAPRGAKLILEYQYPEWAQLWREWRRRNPGARVREAMLRLRFWRGQEDGWLGGADGILYAARGHELLLRRAGYAKPAAWLPSGCLAPEGEAPERAGRDYDVGYVGSLAPENGLELLLEALGRLPQARLLLVGGGRTEYFRELRALSVRLGVDGRVEFAGPVAFKQVRALMRRCRVGVVPISRRQGPEKRQFASPLKLIEWMGAVVPVVASAVPSVRQFAEDGRNALVVEPESAAALAGAVKRILEDEALAAALARAGLEDAERTAWPSRARRIVEFARGLHQA